MTRSQQPSDVASVGSTVGSMAGTALRNRLRFDAIFMAKKAARLVGADRKMIVLLASKVGFSPDLESTRLWKRDFKRQATLGQRLQISEYGLQVLGVSCSLLTCAALRMILLLSSSLRLTHILLAVCRSIKL